MVIKQILHLNVTLFMPKTTNYITIVLHIDGDVPPFLFKEVLLFDIKGRIMVSDISLIY